MSDKSSIALHGGSPIRKTRLPYSRQSVNDGDIQAVTEVLKSDWLTTGPKINEFEEAFAFFVSEKEAVAVNSGTAALHAAMFALQITDGDEVIVPTMTFAATANAVVFQNGTPVFVDCEPDTLLIDPEKVEDLITKKTKAIISVDYAGQPCNYDALRSIADRHSIPLVSDACHSLGGTYKGQPVGSLADLNVFSFHAVKPITTGEGGMITTNNVHFAQVMRKFRNHCITSDHRERHNAGSWFYEMSNLGYNYRLTDFQCALGISQLSKVPTWTVRRQEIANIYNTAFENIDAITPLAVRKGVSHAYHLYVVKLNTNVLTATRDDIFKALNAENIGVNVHYIPVHLHPFYREHFDTKQGMFPVAETAYEQIISLPIFSGMSDDDVSDVIEAVKKVYNYYRK
ncbi:UDP-4-amino-4,6-dideoxy-N-acetyl-beta-L-altrosamine transaminase [Patescibacteria group bacterium]|nr:UDP-4-amino-4,6-dideoxy-N-acetyl-beta-L-altrosamine transaminase [Patescibacteria group bacterium]